MDLGPDIISLVSATLRISTPLVFAAMAGLFAERSGVIDFGLEGKMLAAAFVAASGAHVFGSEWYGLGLAIVCCVALSRRFRGYLRYAKYYTLYVCCSSGCDYIV